MNQAQPRIGLAAAWLYAAIIVLLGSALGFLAGLVLRPLIGLLATVVVNGVFHLMLIIALGVVSGYAARWRVTIVGAVVFALPKLADLRQLAALSSVIFLIAGLAHKVTARMMRRSKPDDNPTEAGIAS